MLRTGMLLLIQFASILCVCVVLGLPVALAAEDGSTPPDSTSTQAKREAEFIKLRNEYRKKSESDPSGAIDVPADLLEKLEIVIGPVRIDGFPAKGRMSPHLISFDPCCQSIDALEFNGPKHNHFYVTTTGLVDNYFGKEGGQEAQGKRKLESVSDYFSGIFSDINGKGARMAELPVKSRPGFRAVRAYLVHPNMDDMTAEAAPQELVVTASIGDRFYIIFSKPDVESLRIDACADIWNEYNEKGLKSAEEYHAGGDKNLKLWKQYLKFAEAGNKALVSCYNKEFKKQPFYAEMVKQAQALVDRIHLPK